jgi:GntR family transcriptional regulator
LEEKKIKIFINANSGIPIYLQIADALKYSIASGLIKEGDKLPSVRELAVQIPANPNTVEKAYQKLIKEGVLEMRRGMGTFVRNDSVEESDLKKLARLLIEKAKSVGLTEEEIMKIVKEEIKNDN